MTLTSKQMLTFHGVMRSAFITLDTLLRLSCVMLSGHWHHCLFLCISPLRFDCPSCWQASVAVQLSDYEAFHVFSEAVLAGGGGVSACKSVWRLIELVMEQWETITAGESKSVSMALGENISLITETAIQSVFFYGDWLTANRREESIKQSFMQISTKQCLDQYKEILHVFAKN